MASHTYGITAAIALPRKSSTCCIICASRLALSVLKKRPRILLADDHPGILSAFQQMLEPNCEVVGIIKDGRNIVDAVTTLRPEVVVLDLSLPSVNGLQACKQIKAIAPQTKVVIVSVATDSDVTREALRIGASAFMLKNVAASELLPTIDKLVA